MTLSTEPANKDEIVTFLSATGEEISNDPRWHARQVMASTGVDVDDLQKQIAQLTAERDAALDAAHTSGLRAGDSGEASETDDDESSNDEASDEEEPEEEEPEEEEPEEDEPEEDEPEEDEYDKLKGAELKKLAKSRGVDISGMTKVSEVRGALRAADQKATD